jgi:hypothetical protein
MLSTLPNDNESTWYSILPLIKHHHGVQKALRTQKHILDLMYQPWKTCNLVRQMEKKHLPYSSLSQMWHQMK